jgi:hypothetical protein
MLMPGEGFTPTYKSIWSIAFEMQVVQWPSLCVKGKTCRFMWFWVQGKALSVMGLIGIKACQDQDRF